ncbi:hypothetical protein GUJ93_ZPchr0006g44797 [Zizania palustris]|uniref:RING-type domain-containing protein n=1 Tax=Zizania palustris TaxID=103762 RepID=A0A8J5W1S8_ZIZPA|nr:hypothetical protein GUJ93_ZPchr0006g44797 [Zizania palustris]
MARRPEFVRPLDYVYGDDSDGLTTIKIKGVAAVPCSGVDLRFNAVVDCRDGKECTPPVTIAFVKHGGDDPEVAGRFTYDCGYFVLLSRSQHVEKMVEAAGFPAECAAVVEDFITQSTSKASNSFWAGVAITIGMAPTGTFVHYDGGDSDSKEDKEAVVIREDCAICFSTYEVGSAAAVKLSCSHSYHRTCLDKWFSVKRTCPLCRLPVTEGIDSLSDYDDDYFNHQHDDYFDLDDDDDDYSGEQ